MAADVAAGFMTITNNGKEEDRLVKATAEISTTVQIHDMKMEGDVMKMEELPDGIVIPAGATVEAEAQVAAHHVHGPQAPGRRRRGIHRHADLREGGHGDVDYEVAAPGGDMSDMDNE